MASNGANTIAASSSCSTRCAASTPWATVRPSIVTSKAAAGSADQAECHDASVCRPGARPWITNSTAGDDPPASVLTPSDASVAAKSKPLVHQPETSFAESPKARSSSRRSPQVPLANEPFAIRQSVHPLVSTSRRPLSPLNSIHCGRTSSAEDTAGRQTAQAAASIRDEFMAGFVPRRHATREKTKGEKRECRSNQRRDASPLREVSRDRSPRGRLSRGSRCR